MIRRNATPCGVVSIEAACGVLPAHPEDPEDPEDLPRRAVFTHGPWIDRRAHGQPLYPALRWITHEGPSPWTPVGAGVVIP
jgi:hypothetical protein